METIVKNKFDLATKIDNKALAYIGLVNDHQQFPAARVEFGASQGVEVYMHKRTSSQTAESMNAANKSVRDRTAVDPVNAMILLLKLEAERYKKNQDKAWEWTEVLTPHGKQLMEKIFKKVNPRDYTITVLPNTNCIKCTVSKNSTGTIRTCWFPLDYDEDQTLFGGCSCKIPNTDGVPCHHMVAVVKSYKIDGLNETNVMPIWWHTSHWRKQYPVESVVFCDFDIDSLRKHKRQSDEMYKLCPPYAGPRKGGRPREEKRIKGGMELSMEKKSKAMGKKGKDKPVEPEVDLITKKIEKNPRAKKARTAKYMVLDSVPIERERKTGTNTTSDSDDNTVLADILKKMSKTNATATTKKPSPRMTRATKAKAGNKQSNVKKNSKATAT